MFAITLMPFDQVCGLVTIGIVLAMGTLLPFLGAVIKKTAAKGLQ